MNLASPSPAGEAERLLNSLTGVVSAHVVTNSDGKIVEIHILSSPSIQPKRVVRNVESALTAGLGIEIDRRIVSVAQIDDEAASPQVQPPPMPREADAGPRPDRADRRFEFVRYSARREIARESTCEVVLRSSGGEFMGAGAGSDTAQGRAEAAARAVFQALASARGDDDLGLEAAAIVDTQGQSFVIVAGRALLGRDSIPLAGAARLIRSPEEAAILAALHATNRWTDPDTG
ncbi:MAG TPA: hypothetical protein VJ957_09860 [Longimicrobiales bacterium]|nr:hypothetical protein [Longimicrobiales bacterium]